MAAIHDFVRVRPPFVALSLSLALVRLFVLTRSHTCLLACKTRWLGKWQIVVPSVLDTLVPWFRLFMLFKLMLKMRPSSSSSSSLALARTAVNGNACEEARGNCGSRTWERRQVAAAVACGWLRLRFRFWLGLDAALSQLRHKLNVLWDFSRKKLKKTAGFLPAPC